MRRKFNTHFEKATSFAMARPSKAGEKREGNASVMLSLGCTMALGLMVTAANAQSTGPTPASGPDTNSELTEIVVTGTQLRGVAPVGSSITTIDRDFIDSSGATTTFDIINLQPQVFDIGVSDTNRLGSAGSSNITYGNSIDLRGLGPYATLTLIDGHRAPPAGTLALAPDPSVIPSLMLERVDIVADGASATYGSDAIAGVANLILRRNFDGVEFSGQKGWGDQYTQNQIGALVGHPWDSGQITLAIEHAAHSDVFGADRSFYGDDLAPRGGTDYRGNSCNPGTISLNGVNYAIPAGGVTPATAAALVANTQNLCDPLKYQDLVPEMEHNNIALTFDQTIGIVHLFGDAYYSHRDYTRLAPLSYSPITVTNANPFFVAPPGTGATSETVNYWFGGQGLGNTWSDKGYSDQHEETVGAEVKLPLDWQFTAQVSDGRDTDQDTEININPGSGSVQAALASTNPATALNLFGANSTALLKSFDNNAFIAPGNTHETTYEAKFNGPVFTLPAGPIKAAVGYEAQWFSTNDGVEVGTYPSPIFFALPLVTYERHWNAVWGEVLFPLVGDANAMPSVQRLDLDVGFRSTRYSDVGDTNDPKIGLNWTPFSDLKVHASYGTSFRAPLLTEINQPIQAISVQTYPTAGGGTVQGYQLTLNNPNLKPETAITKSFGFDWTPAFAPGLKTSLNFFDIDYNNQVVSYQNNTDIVLNASAYPNAVTTCPSAACTALLDKYVLGVGPNAQPLPLLTGSKIANPAYIVDAANLNEGHSLIQGLDLDFSYRAPATDFGNFKVNLNGTYFLRYDEALSPSLPENNVVNTLGYPLKFRSRLMLFWDLGSWSSLATVNYENAYTNNLVTPVQSIASFTSLDLHLTYKFPIAADSILKNTRLDLDVKNVFNAQPPFVNIAGGSDGGGGYDPQIGNPIGRIVSIGFTTKFFGN